LNLRLFEPMQTRAEYFRAEAEKCRAEARKAVTATAVFTLLDLAEQMLAKARQAELEGQTPKK
jgi:hypothetical protein